MAKSSNMGFFYTITEWITRFAYVNILWLVFSLLGLLLFGFFPATIAMFAIVRKWIMGETELPVFQTFWSHYKKEFVKGNLLGLILVILGFIILVDLRFIQLSNNSITALVQIPIYLFIFAFILTTFYLFPVYVHYDINLFQKFKNAFLIMMINPLYNLLMIIGVITVYFALTTIPGLVFFFGGSFLTYIFMWPALRAFEKIDKKKQDNEN
ncbi:YesL family protein [Aquibacillus salsiterrae]|uniref:DUF624 domain-containing protein n=1 Tax=Aquibacillus salsiterrae TaxID=2950439 RepID=A0A9X3WFH3_9BACI|nr:DUF624 domain-containing protein [Aquibacillus salsiterrae]MDC3416071.1 DUF624 domain-containing protein [Aquibacillus salsiterrae]